MRRFWKFWFPFTLTLLAGAVVTLVVAGYQPESPHVTPELPNLARSGNLESDARGILANYCAGCHTRGRSGIDFDDPTVPVSALRRDRATWEQAVKRVRAGKMPPRAFPQPNDEDRDLLIQWIEKDILAPTSESTGPLMARRLQRSEYINAVRDLLGHALQAPSDLPADDAGWDRRSTAPELTVAHLNQYRAAAEAILDEALAEELASLDPSSCDPDDLEMSDAIEAARVPKLFLVNTSGKTEAERAREVLASFARKAYRRPVGSEEIDPLLAVFERAGKEGASFEDGIRAALGEVLTSPHFLYRMETRDSSPAAKAPRSQQIELASRLSFFLWSSTPDDELLALAERGALAQNLEGQVRRMLKDPRSHALATSFAAHWLSLGTLRAEPGHAEKLTQAMRQETELFVASIVCEDRSVLEFLDADYTFLNESLARHYGIPGVQGEQMRRVSLRGTERGGLVTQASFLKLTTTELDTSPVNRGKWVLENLLGVPPIRPTPEAVEALKNTPKKFQAGTARQQTEIHRANPGCAQCHAKMDAIGLSLENFDFNGAWRTKAGPFPVDATGVLPDGETLNGVKDLKAYLLRNREQFVKGLREKLLNHALGRKLNDQDRSSLQGTKLDSAEVTPFSRVLLEVVQSEAFQTGWRGADD